MQERIKAGQFPYGNITRSLTAEERARVEGVKLNEADVDALVERFRNSLTETAMFHSAAVQDSMNINAEISVRFSRFVESSDKESISEQVSRDEVSQVIRGEKVYKN